MGVFAKLYESTLIESFVKEDTFSVLVEATHHQDIDHVESRTQHGDHVVLHKKDHDRVSKMNDGDKIHVGGIMHGSSLDDHYGRHKLHNADANREKDHIHFTNHKTGEHIASVHHKSLSVDRTVGDAD